MIHDRVDCENFLILDKPSHLQDKEHVPQTTVVAMNRPVALKLSRGNKTRWKHIDYNACIYKADVSRAINVALTAVRP